MRAMRACAAANFVFLGVLCTTAGFAACSSGGAPQKPPPAPDAVRAAPVVPPPAPEPALPPPAPAKNAAHCEAPVTEITNEPPAGAVALNNAQTAKDAGATDRLEPLTELIRAKRDGFRCCFDLWTKDHAGAQGSVRMALKLKPDGTLVSVDFGDAPNRVASPEVEGCVGELAKSLTYPPSPSGKETTLLYPFDFKAKSR